MDERDIRHLPVLDGGELVGRVSDRDLLDATGWLPSRVHACRGPEVSDHVPREIREIMRTGVPCTGPDASLDSIAELFLAYHDRCLPVLRSGSLVGIVTERAALSCFLRGDVGPAAYIAVVELMTPLPTTVDWHTRFGDALELCRTEDIEHLPVVQAGRLVGIVSDRDLRRAGGRGTATTSPSARS